MIEGGLQKNAPTPTGSPQITTTAIPGSNSNAATTTATATTTNGQQSQQQLQAQTQTPEQQTVTTTETPRRRNNMVQRTFQQTGYTREDFALLLQLTTTLLLVYAIGFGGFD
jgi:hypothetical protein